jgi:dTDP-4-dehydrorhamnose reductase
LLEAQEVADLLRASSQTVYNMLKDGRPSAYKSAEEIVKELGITGADLEKQAVNKGIS